MSRCVRIEALEIDEIRSLATISIWCFRQPPQPFEISRLKRPSPVSS